MASLLSVENLQVQFQTKKGINTAVDGVSFSVEKGRILGIVGESGCGKSVTSMSILQLLGSNARISGGSIKLDGKELIGLPEKEMCRIRGNDIAMIFQDPMTSLNPTMTIGKQIMESLIIHRGMNKAEARKEAIRMLEMVKIPSPESRIDNYPHELSGGMRQRVMIAIALACNPKILIADEPTTALDVTIQAQIMDLMRELKEKSNTAIILVTHDLGVVANFADRIQVMYAGKIVETSTVEDLFDHPKHPYTKALIESIPKSGRPGEKLVTIPGAPPSLVKPIKGCAFAERCQHANENCKCQQPEMIQVGPGHECACFLSEGKVE